ncbi:MAG: hypothetical protein Kow0077_19810 [Anaerolineae bacterium]
MKRAFWIALLLLLLGLLASGCAPATRAEAAIQATATPAGSEADTPPADSETTEAMANSDPAGTELAAMPAQTRPDSNCIACHSNAEQLQLVAEEEEVKESLSEGSG